MRNSSVVKTLFIIRQYFDHYFAVSLQLIIRGYSHKQSVLLKKVLDHLFAFDFDVRRFDIYKEQLLRSLKNYEAEQPYQHAVYYLALILTEHAWTKQELADAVTRTYFDHLFYLYLSLYCFQPNRKLLHLHRLMVFTDKPIIHLETYSQSL